MRLHIYVVRIKKFFCTIYRQLLSHIDMFTPTIVALAWITFGILVGKDGPLSFKHSGTGVILRSNQLYVLFLTLLLVQYCGPQFFVITLYTFCHFKHHYHLVKSALPRQPSSIDNLSHVPLFTAPLVKLLEPPLTTAGRPVLMNSSCTTNYPQQRQLIGCISKNYLTADLHIP